MVCKFKFVRYGHIKKKLGLYVSRFNYGGPQKSDVSDFQIAKFVFALESKVLRLGGSFLGIWPSIYVLKGWYIETPQKVSITVTFG